MPPIKNALFDYNHGCLNDLSSVDDIFGVLFFVKNIYRFYLSSLAFFLLFISDISSQCMNLAYWPIFMSQFKLFYGENLTQSKEDRIFAFKFFVFCYLLLLIAFNLFPYVKK